MPAWHKARARFALPGLIFSLGIVVVALTRPGLALAQDPFATPSQSPTLSAPPFISFPESGQPVQGFVEITGSTDIPGFQSFTLDFTYQDDRTRTWFEIESSGQNVSAGVLGSWDTRQIGDGDYRLRLQVFAATGETKRFVVGNVRVRNYTPLDTATPTLTPTISATPFPTPTTTLTPTLTVTAFPTPSPLPRNRAEVTSDQITTNLARGAIVAIALFAVFGLIIRLRRA